MAQTLHVTRRPTGGWAVKRSGAARASSVHRTRAEAVAAGRRLASSLGTQLVVHDDAPARAPRAEGPRTTLRVPEELAAAADTLGDELGISRNDALLRLATRGARLYEQEQRIAQRRAARWAAVVPGAVTLDDLPSPAEARDAILALRHAG